MINNSLIVEKEPYSSASESFKTLRTNIQFMNVSEEKCQVILVTSSSPGDGKSWVSSNIAAAFAQSGKKTCLIDVDMRKGRVASIFDISPVPGLSNYLTGINVNGEKGTFKLMQTTEIKNLFIIPAGNIPPNPSELLTSIKMEKLIKKLKAEVDIVILDGTPCSLVTDATIVSRMADQTIIVSSCNTTKSEELKQTKKAIENAGGKVTGIILNKVPLSKKKYGSKYYYNGYIGDELKKEKKRNKKHVNIIKKIKSKFSSKSKEQRMIERIY